MTDGETAKGSPSAPQSAQRFLAWLSGLITMTGVWSRCSQTGRRCRSLMIRCRFTPGSGSSCSRWSLGGRRRRVEVSCLDPTPGRVDLTHGVGPRVEDPGIGYIAGYPFSAPYEDVKLKSK